MNAILVRGPHLGAVGLLTLALAGCHRHSHDGAGGHHHEEKTAQITVWSDRYEVFAEFKPVTAGKPARFVTHVTDWMTGEARSRGPVTFVLRQDGNTVEHPQAAPDRPGIYLPVITFPKPGSWQVALIIPTGETSATVELGAVFAFEAEHSALHADVPDPPEGIVYLKEQQWKLPTRIAPVGRRHLVQRVRAFGKVTARIGSLAQVSPPMSGKLQAPLNGKFPLPGDRVAAGQTLALLQPAFSEATAKLGETEGDIARARFAVAQSRRDYERIKGLFELEVETQRNLELAKLALDSADAQLAALLATQTSYGQGGKTTAGLPAVELKSPIAGVVVSTESIALGQHVSAERALFTVLDAAHVFIDVRVPENDAARIGPATNAVIEFPGRPGELLPLTAGAGGRLIFTSPEIDAATRTVRLLYEAPNSDGRFRVGEHLTVLVESDRAMDAVVIPDSAVVDEDGLPVCFVQLNGETFEKRQLQLGIRDGASVQVRDGVKEGERVVTQGAMALRLASASKVIPAHGHAH